MSLHVIFGLHGCQCDKCKRFIQHPKDGMRNFDSREELDLAIDTQKWHIARPYPGDKSAIHICDQCSTGRKLEDAHMGLVLFLIKYPHFIRMAGLEKQGDDWTNGEVYLSEKTLNIWTNIEYSDKPIDELNPDWENIECHSETQYYLRTVKDFIQIQKEKIYDKHRRTN